MNHEILADAIGEISPELVRDAEQPRVKGMSKKLRYRLLAAAMIVALLVGTVSAEYTAGSVSNLLAPLYGNARTELVDDIGIPVNASATVEGYTLTADAVIGDRYNINIVYTLSRADGQPLPEGVMFDRHTNSVRFGSGGGSLSFERAEDNTKLHIIENWTSTIGFRFMRSAHVEFLDLVVYDRESETDTVLVEGVWALDFTIRYKDATVKVPVNDLEVTGTEGHKYQIHEILLSPLGVHMEITAPNTLSRDDPHSRLLPDFTVHALLTDGSELPLHGGGGGGGNMSSPTMDAHYNGEFSLPTPLDAISALVICGTTLPVEGA